MNDQLATRIECVGASVEFLGNLDKVSSKLKKLEKAPEQLIEAILGQYYEWTRKGHRYKDELQRLEVHYLLQRDYRMAWVMENSSANWGIQREVLATRKYFAESNASKGVQEFWAERRANPNGVWWWHDTSIGFDPDHPEALEQKLEAAMMAGPYGVSYDLAPEARERKIPDHGKYFISHESVVRLQTLLPLLMKLGRHADVGECLVRLRSIIEREPPRWIMEAPKVKHLAPQLAFWENWLAARLETDPEQKRIRGWAAATHLIEAERVSIGTTHFGIEVMQPLCSIFYECELWEDEAEKQEFLRHFVFVCMHGGIETCRKVCAESITPVHWDDQGFPSMRDCEVIFERIRAEAGG